MTVTLRRLTPEEWQAVAPSPRRKSDGRQRVDPSGDGSPEDRRREAMRQYAKNHPEQVVATRVRWEKANPDQARAVWRANKAVHYAVATGRLIRPDICSRCGLPGRRIEAAHHDYSKPLDVTWLCPSCHRFEDRGNAKTKRIA